MNFYESFIDAIHSKKKVEVSFFSREDKTILKRICAPLDIGPMRRNNQIVNQGKSKYHLWDYTSDKKPHPLPLDLEQIRDFKILEEHLIL